MQLCCMTRPRVSNESTTPSSGHAYIVHAATHAHAKTSKMYNVGGERQTIHVFVPAIVFDIFTANMREYCVCQRAGTVRAACV